MERIKGNFSENFVLEMKDLKFFYDISFRQAQLQLQLQLKLKAIFSTSPATHPEKYGITSASTANFDYNFTYNF